MSEQLTPELPFGLVVNPDAALGRGRRVAEHVRRTLDAAGVASILITGTNAAECQEAVRSAAARPAPARPATAAEPSAALRGLILVGGDGLIGTVLQVDEARALPIGVVPAGSGNDLARQYQLPKSPARAVERILTAQPRRVDLGLVRRSGATDHWFAGGLSVGFDAAINRRANAIRLPLGPVRYQVALIAELLMLQPRQFTVTLPGETREFLGLLATAMNIRTVGGGIQLAPDASTEDGCFDLVLISKVSRTRAFSLLGRLAAGTHTSLPEVSVVRVPRARIEAIGEIAYADGDPVGTGPFDVEVVPGALQLLG